MIVISGVYQVNPKAADPVDFASILLIIGRFVSPPGKRKER